MNPPKVSIIVPVYKVEKYLPQCIDSLLAQTYPDFEVLLIDDGSPDNSGAICDEYAARDSRIRVFHKENGGVSSARNLGLDKAEGDWVAFIDSDDCLDPDTLKICSAYFEDYDTVRFSMRRILNVEKTSVLDTEITENDTEEEYLYKVVSRNAILGVCVGLYKLSIFKDNNIRFRTDLISGEDWLAQLQYLLHCKALKQINKPLYLYNRYVESSCTKTFRFEVHYSALRALDEISKTLDNHFGKAGAQKFREGIISGKCMLVYDYLANRIMHKHKVEDSKNQTYKQLANLTLTEVLRARIPMKWKVLLSMYALGLVR